MIVNWTLGYMSFAIFLSVIDRYFSGESYKMSEWINGRSLKFKLGLSLVVSIAPYFFSGVSADTLYVPFRVAGMLMGFYIGEFFLRSFDWAFKKPGEPVKTSEAPAGVVETVTKVIDTIAGSGPAAKEEPKQQIEDDPTRKSVVEAIGGAGANIKDGLKSLGEGIAKASENIFKGDGKTEKEEEKKKDYEPNKNLDDKLKNY